MDEVKENMQAGRKAQYGSTDWFIAEYSKVNDDPWGLSWRPSQQVRYARTLSLLDGIKSPPKSILDIGCALGDFTFLLAKKAGKGCSVIGIDFVADAIGRARTKFPEIQFRVESIFEVGRNYKEEIDIVVCLEVLYYLNRKECPHALASIKESLRSGGHVVFSSLISRKPYFSMNELSNLVSTQFSLVKTQKVYVKPLSTGERVIVKLEALAKKARSPKNTNIVHSFFKAVPYEIANIAERFSSILGDLSASHALVLGRKV
jgi:2-polyprenyl-3-methyl-5-hydroxy-6-metoxy-1,4-benzoquinol methylase